MSNNCLIAMAWTFGNSAFDKAGIRSHNGGQLNASDRIVDAMNVAS
jgi:hypothetical protein